MANYYEVRGSKIISGPHHMLSDEIKRITSCGNPELLGDLGKWGLVPEVRDTLGENQGYGGGELAIDGLSVRLPAIDIAPEDMPAPQAIPAWLAKIALLESGAMGAVTTLAQLDAAVISKIEKAVPAGIERERQKAAWAYGADFSSINAIQKDVLSALEIGQIDVKAIFRTAEKLGRTEAAAVAIPSEVSTKAG